MRTWRTPKRCIRGYPCSSVSRKDARTTRRSIHPVIDLESGRFFEAQGDARFAGGIAVGQDRRFNAHNSGIAAKLAEERAGAVTREPGDPQIQPIRDFQIVPFCGVKTGAACADVNGLAPAFTCGSGGRRGRD